MALFEPAWKTKNENKARAAARSVKRIDSPEQLNEVVIKAPLWQTKAAAIERLKDITKGSYQPDERTRMGSLHAVDMEQDLYADEAFTWYVRRMLEGLPADRVSEFVLKANSEDIRYWALTFISGEEDLIRLGSAPALREKQREEVLERLEFFCGRKPRDIAEDGTLPMVLRSAAAKKAEEEEQREAKLTLREKEAEEKRKTCAETGHRMKFVRLEYVRGGKEQLYRCEVCGEEQRLFYEGNTDSV